MGETFDLGSKMATAVIDLSDSPICSGPAEGANWPTGLASLNDDSANAGTNVSTSGSADTSDAAVSTSGTGAKRGSCNSDVRAETTPADRFGRFGIPRSNIASANRSGRTDSSVIPDANRDGASASASASASSGASSEKPDVAATQSKCPAQLQCPVCMELAYEPAFLDGHNHNVVSPRATKLCCCLDWENF